MTRHAFGSDLRRRDRVLIFPDLLTGCLAAAAGLIAPGKTVRAFLFQRMGAAYAHD